MLADCQRLCELPVSVSGQYSLSWPVIQWGNGHGEMSVRCWAGRGEALLPCIGTLMIRSWGSLPWKGPAQPSFLLGGGLDHYCSCWGSCEGFPTKQGRAWSGASYPACTGDVHVLGQTFWMALDALRFLHKLPRLPGRRTQWTEHAIPRVAVTISSNTNGLAQKLRSILRAKKGSEC